MRSTAERARGGSRRREELLAALLVLAPSSACSLLFEPTTSPGDGEATQCPCDAPEECAPVVRREAGTLLSLTARDGWVYFGTRGFGGDGHAVHRLRPTGDDGGAWPAGHFPVDLAIDGEHLYWVEYRTRIQRIRLDDWATGPLGFHEDGTLPRNLAADRTHVYWTTEAGGGASALVRRLPVASPFGEPEDVACAGFCRSLAVDELHVYWVDDRAIRFAPRDDFRDAAARTLVANAGPNPPSGLARGGDRLFWYSSGTLGIFGVDAGVADQAAGVQVFHAGSPHGLAAVAVDLFYTDRAPPRTCRGDLAAADLRCVPALAPEAPEESGPTEVAADGASAFWLVQDMADDSGGEIRCSAFAR